MSTHTIEDPVEEARRRIDRLQAFAQIAPCGQLTDSAAPRRAAPGGGIRPGGGPRGPRRGRGEARTAEDEACGRPELAARRPLRRVDDVRGRRRGRAPHLGHLPRAAAGDGRGKGRRCARAGRGGDRRRPHPTDRGLRPPRAARAEVDGAWHEQRNQVSAARDELESKAAELEQHIRAHATAKPVTQG